MRRLAPLLFALGVAGLAATAAAAQTPFHQFRNESSAAREEFWSNVGFRRAPYDYSIAVVMGVSQLDCSSAKCSVPEVDADIDHLVGYFKDADFFDEILVIRNQDFNVGALETVFASYIPRLAEDYGRLRLVVTFSGHGGIEDDAGYFFKSTATSLEDFGEAISADTLRSIMGRSLRAAYHSLVLINACHAGAFLSRALGDTVTDRTVQSLLDHRGSHVITSSGSAQRSWIVKNYGRGGTVFFDAFLNVAEELTARSGMAILPDIQSAIYNEVTSATTKEQTPETDSLDRSAEAGGGIILFDRRRPIKVSTAEAEGGGEVSLGADPDLMLSGLVGAGVAEMIQPEDDPGSPDGASFHIRGYFSNRQEPEEIEVALQPSSVLCEEGADPVCGCGGGICHLDDFLSGRMDAENISLVQDGARYNAILNRTWTNKFLGVCRSPYTGIDHILIDEGSYSTAGSGGYTMIRVNPETLALEGKSARVRGREMFNCAPGSVGTTLMPCICFDPIFERLVHDVGGRIVRLIDWRESQPGEEEIAFDAPPPPAGADLGASFRVFQGFENGRSASNEEVVALLEIARDPLTRQMYSVDRLTNPEDGTELVIAYAHYVDFVVELENDYRPLAPLDAWPLPIDHTENESDDAAYDESAYEAFGRAVGVVLYRSPGSLDWRVLYTIIDSMKGGPMVPEIAAFDAARVEARLCYAECDWWGRFGRVSYDMASGKAILEEAIEQQ
jgi:hypothetical protein